MKRLDTWAVAFFLVVVLGCGLLVCLLTPSTSTGAEGLPQKTPPKNLTVEEVMTDLPWSSRLAVVHDRARGVTCYVAVKSGESPAVSCLYDPPTPTTCQ